MKSIKFFTLIIAAVAFLSACQKAQEKTEEAADAAAETSEEVVETVANVWESEAEVQNAVIEEEGTPAEAPAEAMTYTVNLDESKLGWKGSKLAYYHYGTIDIQSGSLSVVDGKLVAGNFTIDMSTIKDLDLEEKGKLEDKAKLEGHLKSDDFFNVEEYPNSTFTITDVEQIDGNKYMVSGNLTMKDTTHKITFPAEIEVTENGVNAKALFSIDRTKWGVNYNSGNIFTDLVADQVISDRMAINLELVAG